jgi:hypothetical protein
MQEMLIAAAILAAIFASRVAPERSPVAGARAPSPACGSSSA